MTITQKGLLVLIKSALTGETLALPEDFSLEQADPIIQSQSLLPLAYQGAYNCGIPLDAEIMIRYKKQYYAILLQHERQMQAVQQIYDAFEKNGIDYMPLKGCILKDLYPQPEMRIMGDADILIRLEQYDKIRPIMKELGFQYQSESDHDFSWVRSELHVELHKSLLPPKKEAFYDYTVNGWELAVSENGCRYTMHPEDIFIYLFVHMTKHYHRRGIGSRQFLDLFLLRHAYPQMEEAYIEKEMDRIHLLEFYQNVSALLNCWFDEMPANEITEAMTQYIFSGGNWGIYERYLQTREATARANPNSPGNAKGTVLRKMLFPPLQEMQSLYRTLVKLPYLLPFFWVFRGFQLFFRNPALIVRKIYLIRHISADESDARLEELNFVGLHFYDV